MPSNNIDKCDRCGQKAELFHNEDTGLAYCWTCDMDASDPAPLPTNGPLTSCERRSWSYTETS